MIFFKPLSGIFKLSRINEFIGPLILVTVLGITLIQPLPYSKIVLIIIANLLNLSFAFMINDIEDFEDDANCAIKSQRNPITANQISHQTAYLVTVCSLIISLVIYYLLGIESLIFGLTGSVIAFLYSWKRVRLKSVPVLDIFSHGVFLWTVNFCAAAFLIGIMANTMGFLFLAIAIFVTSMLAKLSGDARDYRVDRSNRIRNTAAILNPSRIFLLTNLLTIVIAFLVLIYILTIISPLGRYVLLLLALFAGVHYYYSWGRIRGRVFAYPYGNKLLILTGVVLVIFH